LSRDLQLNCVISFFFRLHLVLHACAVRFDVTDTVVLFRFTFRELHMLLFALQFGKNMKFVARCIFFKRARSGPKYKSLRHGCIL
jgi:hypothetical protein